MSLFQIANEDEYQQALEELELVFDAPLNTYRHYRAVSLVSLIEEYEIRHYPIDDLVKITE